MVAGRRLARCAALTVSARLRCGKIAGGYASGGIYRLEKIFRKSPKRFKAGFKSVVASSASENGHVLRQFFEQDLDNSSRATSGATPGRMNAGALSKADRAG